MGEGVKGGEDSAHSEQSSYRSILIEHLFTGELLRTLWPRRAEVLKPQVDDGGYDLVVEFEGVVRHIQIKTSKRSAKTARQKVNERLQEKPSGCVIWIQFDEHDFKLGPFLWFGNSPGKPLPCLSGFKTAHHTKGDSTGKKSERPAICEVLKGRFEELEDVTEVAVRLFGPSVGGGRPPLAGSAHSP